MERLRIAKEWSQSDAARFAAKKYPHITRNVIVHLEAGKTRDPKPPLLRAFADLYSAPYEEIALHFFRDKYGIEGLQATEARTKTGRSNLLETRTSPVTDSEDNQKSTLPTPSSTSEDPVAGTVAVRPSVRSPLAIALDLEERALSLSALAHELSASAAPGRPRSRAERKTGRGKHPPDVHRGSAQQGRKR